MKTLALIVICSLLLVAAGSAWYVNDQRQRLELQPLRTRAQPQRIVVAPGTTIVDLANDLAARELIDNPHSLVWYARWYGLSSKIKAGEYEVDAVTTPVELLNLIVSGKVVQWSFTIIEGWNFKTLRERLKRNNKLVHTLTDEDDATVMRLLGHPDVHPEGWFFPDTYHFPAGTTDVEFLRRALNTMHAVLNEAWEKRAEDLPYQQPYHALILASIVEKETAAAVERGDIAGVFVRRLRKGMRLEADPTVIYGLGDDFDGNLTRKHLKTDTPYNTYTRRGLPPTPIAIPSGAAVEAALNPVDGDTLFFVARGDGSGTHEFSATYAEHQKAVQRYLRNRKKRLADDSQG